MAEAADVRSIDALRDVRAAVCAFTEEAKNALADVDFDIRRTTDWLQNEQRLYWQAEQRRWEQNLQMAKAELARKKLGRFLDHKPDTSQEEKAVRLAQARIEEAQKKQELLKKWMPELLRAVQEYRGSAQPLASLVEVELQRAIVRIDRMLESLEAYLQMTAPRTEGVGRAERPVLSAGESMARGEPTGTSDDERQRGLEQAEPGDADAPREVGQHGG